MRHRIFISYSTADQAFATGLHRDFEQQGLSCWMATEALRAGDDWAERIGEAVKQCERVVVVLSRHARDSVYVPLEIQAAVDHRKPMVVFRLDHDDPGPKLKFLLGGAQWVDATARSQRELVSDVESTLPPARRVLWSVALLAVCTAACFATTAWRLDGWRWTGIASAVLFILAAGLTASVAGLRAAVLRIARNPSWTTISLLAVPAVGVVFCSVVAAMNPPRVIYIATGEVRLLSKEDGYKVAVAIGAAGAQPTQWNFEEPMAIGCRSSIPIGREAKDLLAQRGVPKEALSTWSRAACIPVPLHTADRVVVSLWKSGEQQTPEFSSNGADPVLLLRQ